MSAETKTVAFGSAQREVPLNKASKWYPTEAEHQPKKARKTARPTTLRPTLQPGSVLIILAGRYRGKRVVYLKPLTNGVILITGPFKVNGVPLRRVNARYVIATSTKIDISGVTGLEKFDDKYFIREKEERKSREAEFYEQGEDGKPVKKEIPEVKKDDQKAVDAAIIKSIKAEPHLAGYLSSTFSLSKGDKPHLMKW